MKRIIRGIVPPAKKMAKRLSGEAASKLEGDGSCGAVKIENDDADKNDVEYKVPTSENPKENSSNHEKLEKSQKSESSLKESMKSSSIDPKKCQSKANLKVRVSSEATSAETYKVLRLKITKLETPEKSENDKKEYKVIKLQNGLTALLISDVKNIIELDPEDCTLENEELMEGTDAESSTQESEEESDIESIASMDSEANTFEESGKKCQSTEEKLAAVSLTVGVGSFSDPTEIPGLAHFLEHMVFMGSAKFPQENDFDEYVKKQGGSDNACTNCEITTFYFDCHEKGLLRTMDRFAQFFISPLMKREAITREREAIESEFQMSVTSDDDRKSQLISSMAFERHPATKFTWGNMKTLRDNVTDDHLYEAVHEFRKRHYSAHRMTLAVQARLPLELLEKWVADCFSGIPNNNLPPEDFSSLIGPAYDPEKFCKLYTVNPVKDVCNMDITWSMAPCRHLYRKKPLEYISWCLSHEGHGSLISYLRKKVWALDVISDNPDYDFENNELYRLYSLNIILTKEGLRHLPEVIESVFAYIKLLKNKGPQEWLFKEIQSIEEMSFRFVDEAVACEYVEALSESMQKYPPREYITADQKYFEYDPEVITSCLQNFRLDNVNIMVSTKTPREGVTFDQTEPWFGTQYHVEDIPPEWVDKWSQVEPYPDFALPEKNPFIPTDFSILPEEPDTRGKPFPTKLVETDTLELWYRRDYKFLVPHAFLYVYFVTPVTSESALTQVLLDLFNAILKQQSVEELYPARMADLEYTLECKERGFSIRCWGFNQKLPVMLITLVKQIKCFNEKLDEHMFAAVKDKLQQHYYNLLLKPETVSSDLRLYILLLNNWTALERYEAMQTITLDMLKSFVTRCFDQLYVQILAQGNILKDEAISIGNRVIEIMDCKPLPLDQRDQRRRICQIPIGEKVCRVRSFNKEDSNCVTTNYYQSGRGCIEEFSTIEMIIMLMAEPLFDILRTKEQLGYHVYCLSTDTSGITGFLITVISQLDKHSNEHVDKRIEEFLKTFINDLKHLSTEEFDTVLQSLIKLKNGADVHMQEEVDRNWFEIENQEYVFDRRKKAVEYLQELTPPVVIKWLEDHTLCNLSKVRKLSVQIMGNDPKKKDGVDNVSNGSDEVREGLAYVCLPTDVENSDYFIKDLAEFKKKLYVYPAHKLLS